MDFMTREQQELQRQLYGGALNVGPRPQKDQYAQQMLYMLLANAGVLDEKPGKGGKAPYMISVAYKN